MIEIALANRPDIFAGYATLEASREGVKKAKSDFMPKIGVFGTLSSYEMGVSAGGLPQIENNGFNGNIMVGATIPLYDAGMRDANLKRAQSQVDAAERNFEQLKDAAAREIVLASNALTTAVQANNSDVKLRQAAYKTYDSALDSYKNGIGTVSALATAQTASSTHNLPKAMPARPPLPLPQTSLRARHLDSRHAIIDNATITSARAAETPCRPRPALPRRRPSMHCPPFHPLWSIWLPFVALAVGRPGNWRRCASYIAGVRDPRRAAARRLGFRCRTPRRDTGRQGRRAARVDHSRRLRDTARSRPDYLDHAIRLESAEEVARDTVFAAVMIVLNGIIGLCLVRGGRLYHEQSSNSTPQSAALAVLGTLSTLAFVLRISPFPVRPDSTHGVSCWSSASAALCSTASSCSCRRCSIAIISSMSQA